MCQFGNGFLCPADWLFLEINYSLKDTTVYYLQTSAEPNLQHEESHVGCCAASKTRSSSNRKSAPGKRAGEELSNILLLLSLSAKQGGICKLF